MLEIVLPVAVGILCFAFAFMLGGMFEVWKAIDLLYTDTEINLDA